MSSLRENLCVHAGLFHAHPYSQPRMQVSILWQMFFSAMVTARTYPNPHRYVPKLTIALLKMSKNTQLENPPKSLIFFQHYTCNTQCELHLSLNLRAKKTTLDFRLLMIFKHCEKRS